MDEHRRPPFGVTIRVGPRPAIVVEPQGMPGVPDDAPTRRQQRPVLRLLDGGKGILDGTPQPDGAAAVDQPDRAPSGPLDAEPEERVPEVLRPEA